MKTIKLPYNTLTEDKDFILDLQRQYSIVLRSAYNRFHKDKLSQKEVRNQLKDLSGIPDLNSWFIQCAILDGQAIQTRFKDENVVFGGKKLFKLRKEGKISKEEFKLKRLSPIKIQGETLKKGNRTFELDIIDNNQIIFKPFKGKRIKLELPNLKNNIRRKLEQLENLNDVKQGVKGHTFSVTLTSEYISLSFEDIKRESKTSLNDKRYLGIDLNPENIGFSIVEEQLGGSKKVLHTEDIRLEGLTNRIYQERNSSDSKRSKYLNNKLDSELFEISKHIVKLAKHFKVSSVFIEKLDFKNKFNSKTLNRLTRNIWKKNKFIENLGKRCQLIGIKVSKVNPVYSSFIGNMQHNYSDAVNASLEIGRRGQDCFKNKVKGFYPVMEVKNQWKKEVSSFESWKEFFDYVKNSRMVYRVSLEDIQYSVFSFKSRKSRVKRLSFV